MLIIDARYYLNGPVSGVYVVKNIVDNLIDNYIGEIILILAFEEKNNSYLNFIKTSKVVRMYFFPRKLYFISTLLLIPILSYRHSNASFLLQNYTPLIKAKGTKYYTFIHDFIFKESSEYFSLIQRIVFELIYITSYKSYHIFTVTNTERLRIHKYTQGKVPISVCYNGLTDAFRVLSLSEKVAFIKSKYLPQKYVLYVGRIDKRKNFKVLEEYLKLDMCLPIVVVGPDYPRLQSNKLIYLGYIPENELPKIFGCAEVLVYPSLDEGFGLPPLQSLACGVRVLLSDIEVFRELYGSVAIFFSKNDAKDFAQKLLRMQTEEINVNLSDILSESVSKFNWRSTVKQLLTEIE